VPICCWIANAKADAEKKERAKKEWDEAKQERKDTYTEYLKSDDWKRKRYVVLKRDNWKCVHCGVSATEVHHKKYAPFSIGREPIEWLESVCNNCHSNQHGIEKNLATHDKRRESSSAQRR